MKSLIRDCRLWDSMSIWDEIKVAKIMIAVDETTILQRLSRWIPIKLQLKQRNLPRKVYFTFRLQDSGFVLARCKTILDILQRFRWKTDDLMENRRRKRRPQVPTQRGSVMQKRLKRSRRFVLRTFQSSSTPSSLCIRFSKHEGKFSISQYII